MKKNNGRRKSRQQAKNSRKPVPAQARKSAAPAAVPTPRHIEAPRQLGKARVAARDGARTSARRGVDWAAIAIVVVSLTLLALIEFGTWGPSTAALAPWRGNLATEAMPLAPDVRSRIAVAAADPLPAPWHGDLALEAMPLAPDVRSRVAVTVSDPPPAPWHGDLALEDMPLVPDVRSRVAVTVSDPPPAPWHGDLALEDMPLQPDTRSRVAVAAADPPPAPWHGDLALEDMPLQPDTRSRAPFVPLIGEAVASAAAAPICLPEELEPVVDADTAPPQAPAAFGRALADAAGTQTEGFVVYNPSYVTIAYPRGDTQPLYGVCTDVVVRAYRALGIDLQELIHTSRLGRGDPNIDHRRVEVVRRFFERYGTSLAISEFAEDYLPGDVVTYHRPNGRVSQFHIAVVSDRIAPSGRPMVVHNRGWGPQFEDSLFVDRITGHYRFTPHDADAFIRSRPPRVSDRRSRTADVATTKQR